MVGRAVDVEGGRVRLSGVQLGYSLGPRWPIRSIPASGGPSRPLVNFDDPERQPVRHAFKTEGTRFYFTVGSRERDVWAAELTER